MVITPQHGLQAQQHCLQTEHVQTVYRIASPLQWLWEVHKFDVWEESGPDVKKFNFFSHESLVSGSFDEVLHEEKDAL